MQLLGVLKRFLVSRANPVSAILCVVAIGFSFTASRISFGQDGEESSDAKFGEKAEESLPASETEALGRASWLHETMHGALQVMHRDFFGDGDDAGGGSLSLPSQSLEDVFQEMTRSWKVEIRWLGVDATKDMDHEPADEFERAAAKALKGGDEEYSAVEQGRFRFVGAITLHNQCLKCHVPNRTTIEDRVAGLSLTFPIDVPTEN